MVKRGSGQTCFSNPAGSQNYDISFVLEENVDDVGQLRLSAMKYVGHAR